MMFVKAMRRSELRYMHLILEGHNMREEERKLEHDRDREAYKNKMYSMPLSVDVQNVITLPRCNVSIFLHNGEINRYNLTTNWFLYGKMGCAIRNGSLSRKTGNNTMSAFI